MDVPVIDRSNRRQTQTPAHQAPPCTLVIFGAGGDLTKRLIMPALYNLVRAGKLPDDFAIIGVDHNDLTTEEWCGDLAEMMQAFMRAGGSERRGDQPSVPMIAISRASGISL